MRPMIDLEGETDRNLQPLLVMEGNHNDFVDNFSFHPAHFQLALELYECVGNRKVVEQASQTNPSIVMVLLSSAS